MEIPDFTVDDVLSIELETGKRIELKVTEIVRNGMILECVYFYGAIHREPMEEGPFVLGDYRMHIMHNGEDYVFRETKVTKISVARSAT